MTETELERRLRRAMGPSTDTPPPDQSALAAIRQRTTPDPIRGRLQPKLAYRAVLAAGAGVVVVALAVSATNTGRWVSSGQPPASGQPVALPAAPSPWWLALVAVVASAATGLAARRSGRSIVTVAVALIGAGVLVTAAVTLSRLREGAALAQQAPEVPGYQIAGAELRLRQERLPPYRLVTITYQALPGTPGPPDGLSRSEPLGPWGRSLGFTDSYPNLDQRCIQVTTPGRFSWEGDYYCVVGAGNGELLVAATRYAGSGLSWPQESGLPLIWLGLICLTLALVDRSPGERGRSSQLRYGVSLLLFSLALFLSGQIAYDLVRVGSFEFARGCGFADPNWSACQDQIRAVIDDRQVAGSATRLYGPVVALWDLLALVFVGLGWLLLPRPGGGIGSLRRLLAAARGRPVDGLDPADGRRYRLPLALTIAVVVLVVVFQIAFRQRLGILTDFNE